MLADAVNAFAVLVKMLFLPAAILLGAGVYQWNTGSRTGNKDKVRLGKMLTMFGVILMVLLQIVYWGTGLYYGINP